MAFAPASEGGMKVVITQPGAVNEGVRTTASPSNLNLAAYAGTYWSEELETQYALTISDGKLIATDSHHGVTPLRSTSQKDSFRSDWWFASDLKFVRAESGDRITGVRMGGGRLRGVLFVKK